MKPKKIHDTLWYAMDGKRIFKDICNKNLEFLTEKACVDWCDSRNELDNICFITGRKLNR